MALKTLKNYESQEDQKALGVLLMYNLKINEFKEYLEKQIIVSDKWASFQQRNEAYREILSRLNSILKK
jgi:hypothetical protein